MHVVFSVSRNLYEIEKKVEKSRKHEITVYRRSFVSSAVWLNPIFGHQFSRFWMIKLICKPAISASIATSIGEIQN